MVCEKLRANAINTLALANLLVPLVRHGSVGKGQDMCLGALAWSGGGVHQVGIEEAVRQSTRSSAQRLRLGWASKTTGDSVAYGTVCTATTSRAELLLIDFIDGLPSASLDVVLQCLGLPRVVLIEKLVSLSILLLADLAVLNRLGQSLFLSPLPGRKFLGGLLLFLNLLLLLGRVKVKNGLFVTSEGQNSQNVQSLSAGSVRMAVQKVKKKGNAYLTASEKSIQRATITGQATCKAPDAVSETANSVSKACTAS